MVVSEASISATTSARTAISASSVGVGTRAVVSPAAVRTVASSPHCSRTVPVTTYSGTIVTPVCKRSLCSSRTPLASSTKHAREAPLVTDRSLTPHFAHGRVGLRTSGRPPRVVSADGVAPPGRRANCSRTSATASGAPSSSARTRRSPSATATGSGGDSTRSTRSSSWTSRRARRPHTRTWSSPPRRASRRRGPSPTSTGASRSSVRPPHPPEAPGWTSDPL